MTAANPLAALAGLAAVVVAAMLLSLLIAGHLVGVAIAGAVIAYGLFVWQSRRLARFERSVGDGRD